MRPQPTDSALFVWLISDRKRDQLQIVVHRLETSHPEEDAVGSRSSPESVLWRRALVRSKALVNATSELFDWGIVRYQKVQDPLHMKVMLPLVRPGSWSFDFPELHVNNSLVTSPGRERTFSEAFSDSCVYQLTRTRTPDECKISNPCFDFMTQPHTSHYWLTHQVFYTLIGIKAGDGLSAADPSKSPGPSESSPCLRRGSRFWRPRRRTTGIYQCFRAFSLLQNMNFASWSFDFPELHVNNSLVTSPGRERTFSEAFSDSCVYQLTRTRSPDECKISNPCFDFMTQPHTSHYWLTHQVFYTLIGIKSECRDRLLSLLAEHQGGLKSFLIKTCSNVMRDALNAKDEGFPETLQDLFIEQIGFCGMAGFPEFYRPDWIRTIQSWEREDGCFSDHRDWDPQRAFENHFPLLRNKRSEIFLKDDCRFHKTILGAITMTTGLKFLLS
ncbi:UPF0764 protein C16orf89 isoform X2 [Ixodes scapularis]